MLLTKMDREQDLEGLRFSQTYQNPVLQGYEAMQSRNYIPKGLIIIIVKGREEPSNSTELLGL